MSSDPHVLEKAVCRTLCGKRGHVEARRALEGLDWKVAGARPDGVSHSIFQLLNHMIYWQEWVVKWDDGKKPRIPKHASGSWPGKKGPTSREGWEQTVRRFGEVLGELERRSQAGDLLSKRGRRSRLEMFQAIASHNSYHLGQLVLVRRMLGQWPPPSGGMTW
ncbi:MAG: DinB family protein [Acidobacteriota bacterium]